MIKIKLIAVGKIKERFYTDACNEYLKRLQSYCNIEIIEISEYKCADNPSAAEISTVLKKEGERILNAIPDGAYVIPMCIEGKMLDSVSLSKQIEKTTINGYGTLCFIIGGSFGLDEAVKSKANLKLSMSSMTFPHMLARVMLLEQIYRTLSILSGSKYHK